MKVKILGPAGLGSSHTSYKNAVKYVDVQRRARWANPQKTAIRFIESDPRHQAAMQCQQRYSDGGRGNLDMIMSVFGVSVSGAARLLSAADGDWAWVYAVWAKDRRDGPVHQVTLPVTLPVTPPVEPSI